MTSFFSSIIGGAFSTQVGQLIEKATDVGQVSEDWSLYMEICDHVNVSEDGPKDAIKAIKKQLANNIGKNSVVILYTLTVLETCVKNCGRPFHIQVAQKDFLQELIRVISPKGNPPQVVIDKVLSLLQMWADAFQGCDDLKEVEKVCIELKEKGMEFPLTDLDRAAPIHTPVRSMPIIEPSSPSRQTMEVARVIPGSEQTAAPGSPTVDSEKLGKLRSELNVVQQNCKVMGEMLTELTPGQEPLEDDWQLLTELNATCHQMQKRIVKLIQKVQSEDVTCELLRINDDLNNILLRYERYERQRGGQTGQITTTTSSAPPVYATVQKGTVSSEKVAETSSLIDFGDSNPVQPLSTESNDDFSKIATLSIRGNSTVKDTNPALPSADGQGNDDEFDGLAQSRQLHEQSHRMLRDGTGEKKTDVPSELGAAVLPTNETNPCASEIEVSEMEHWLKDTQGLTQQSATSSEFDQFLATHTATESDKLLDVSVSPSQTNRDRRMLQDNGGDSDALFTL